MRYEQDKIERAYRAFLRENGIVDRGGLWKMWLAAYNLGHTDGRWSVQRDLPSGSDMVRR